MTSPSEELAELLTELKQRSGRSYEWIGRRVHAGKSTVQRYCTGNSVPPEFSMLERIARACGATSDEIGLLFRRWERATATSAGGGVAGPTAGSEHRQSGGVETTGGVEAAEAAAVVEVSAGPERPVSTVTKNPASLRTGWWGSRRRRISALGLGLLLMLLAGVAAMTAAAGSRAKHRPPSPAPANGVTTRYISVMPPDGSPSNDLKVLDIKEYSTVNGGLAQLWRLRTTGEVRNQRWTIVRVGTLTGHVYYELRNQLSGKCLDMAADVPTENGVRVQQWDCNSGANQRWLAVPSHGTDNWVQLVNMTRPTGADRLCLDATASSYADGTLLQVSTCDESWNQRWNI